MGRAIQRVYLISASPHSVSIKTFASTYETEEVMQIEAYHPSGSAGLSPRIHIIRKPTLDKVQVNPNIEGGFFMWCLRVNYKKFKAVVNPVRHRLKVDSERLAKLRCEFVNAEATSWERWKIHDESDGVVGQYLMGQD